MTRTSDFLVVIPAYNEEETIREVVLGAQRYADVCVVNDGSKDRTPQILGEIDGVHVINHETNTHIAGAISDGMKYALEAGYRYCICMDAGLSHRAEDMPNFLNAPDADLVLGVRVEKTNTPVYRRALSFLGNIAYNAALDFPGGMFRRPYRDLCTGYRRYSRAALEAVTATPPRSRSFDFILEATLRIHRAGLTITETPIVYNFTESSLRAVVVLECLRFCWRTIRTGD